MDLCDRPWGPQNPHFKISASKSQLQKYLAVQHVSDTVRMNLVATENLRTRTRKSLVYKTFQRRVAKLGAKQSG